LEAVCVFVNVQVNAAVIARLHSLDVRLIALRCAGYNNVDIAAATKHDITVVRVPAYSPYAMTEHTGLILSDDVFARLLTFPNVIITGHQAFFTREALLNIAGTTIDNIIKFENNQPLEKLAG
jgi:lactate dehydrogenase-like 2-hydroxyacid dehydrogenase